MKLRTGDQFLIRSETILSRGIRAFMRRYAKQRGIEISDNDIYSHAGFIINDGTVRIAEAVENGYKIRTFDRYYNLNMDCCVMRLQQLPDDNEIRRMVDMAYYLQEINWGYQYWNFPQWMALILLKKNLFVDNNRWLYCFEGNYRVYHAGRDWSFTFNAEITDYFKLYDLSRFNIIHKTRR